MNDIAAIPYVEAEFDKDGNLSSPVSLTSGVTDLFVISHGWNNDAARARALYENFFTSFVAVAQPGDLPGRSLAIVGVIWPSKEFDELVAVSGASESAEGSANLEASDEKSRKAVALKLESMKDFFTEPAQRRALDQAKSLLLDLEDKASARRDFVDRLRSLLDADAADKEDASQTFF